MIRKIQLIILLFTLLLQISCDGKDCIIAADFGDLVTKQIKLDANPYSTTNTNGFKTLEEDKGKYIEEEITCSTGSTVKTYWLDTEIEVTSEYTPFTIAVTGATNHCAAISTSTSSTANSGKAIVALNSKTNHYVVAESTEEKKVRVESYFYKDGFNDLFIVFPRNLSYDEQLTPNQCELLEEGGDIDCDATNPIANCKLAVEYKVRQCVDLSSVPATTPPVTVPSFNTFSAYKKNKKSQNRHSVEGEYTSLVYKTDSNKYEDIPDESIEDRVWSSEGKGIRIVIYRTNYSVLETVPLKSGDNYNTAKFEINPKPPIANENNYKEENCANDSGNKYYTIVDEEELSKDERDIDFTIYNYCENIVYRYKDKDSIGYVNLELGNEDHASKYACPKQGDSVYTNVDSDGFQDVPIDDIGGDGSYVGDLDNRDGETGRLAYFRFLDGDEINNNYRNTTNTDINYPMCICRVTGSRGHGCFSSNGDRGYRKGCWLRKSRCHTAFSGIESPAACDTDNGCGPFGITHYGWQWAGEGIKYSNYDDNYGTYNIGLTTGKSCLFEGEDLEFRIGTDNNKKQVLVDNKFSGTTGNAWNSAIGNIFVRSLDKELLNLRDPAGLTNNNDYECTPSSLEDLYKNNAGAYYIKINSTKTASYIADIKGFIDGKFGDIFSLGAREKYFIALVGKRSPFQRILTLALILYVAFLGATFLLGMSELNQQQLLMAIIKFGVVRTLLSPDSWQFFVWMINIFEIGAEELGVLLAGGISEDSGDLNRTLFGKLDQIVYYLLQPEIHIKASAIFFSPILIGILMGFMVYYAFFLMLYAVARAMIIFITIKIMFVILFMVAPIFILLSLFERTKGTFNNWLKNTTGYAMQLVLLYAVIAFFSYFILAIFFDLFFFGVCWKPVWVFNINNYVEFELFSFWRYYGFSPRYSESYNFSRGPDFVSVLFFLTIAYLFRFAIDGASNLGRALGGGSIGTSGGDMAAGLMKSLSGAAGQGAKFARQNIAQPALGRALYAGNKVARVGLKLGGNLGKTAISPLSSTGSKLNANRKLQNALHDMYSTGDKNMSKKERREERKENKQKVNEAMKLLKKENGLTDTEKSRKSELRRSLSDKIGESRTGSLIKKSRSLSQKAQQRIGDVKQAYKVSSSRTVKQTLSKLASGVSSGINSFESGYASSKQVGSKINEALAKVGLETRGISALKGNTRVDARVDSQKQMTDSFYKSLKKSQEEGKSPMAAKKQALADVRNALDNYKVGSGTAVGLPQSQIDNLMKKAERLADKKIFSEDYLKKGTKDRMAFGKKSLKSATSKEHSKNKEKIKFLKKERYKIEAKLQGKKEGYAEKKRLRILNSLESLEKRNALLTYQQGIGNDSKNKLEQYTDLKNRTEMLDMLQKADRLEREHNKKYGGRDTKPTSQEITELKLEMLRKESQLTEEDKQRITDITAAQVKLDELKDTEGSKEEIKEQEDIIKSKTEELSRELEEDKEYREEIERIEQEYSDLREGSALEINSDSDLEIKSDSGEKEQENQQQEQQQQQEEEQQQEEQQQQEEAATRESATTQEEQQQQVQRVRQQKQRQLQTNALESVKQRKSRGEEGLDSQIAALEKQLRELSE